MAKFNVKDRISSKPNIYLLNGEEYEITLADNPIIEGTKIDASLFKSFENEINNCAPKPHTSTSGDTYGEGNSQQLGHGRITNSIEDTTNIASNITLKLLDSRDEFNGAIKPYTEVVRINLSDFLTLPCYKNYGDTVYTYGYNRKTPFTGYKFISLATYHCINTSNYFAFQIVPFSPNIGQEECTFMVKLQMLIDPDNIGYSLPDRVDFVMTSLWGKQEVF